MWDTLATFATIWIDIRTTTQSILDYSTMDDDLFHNMLDKNNNMVDKDYVEMAKV